MSGVGPITGWPGGAVRGGATSQQVWINIPGKGQMAAQVLPNDVELLDRLRIRKDGEELTWTRAQPS